MTIKLVQDMAKTKREPRSPQHPFQLRIEPFALQPFLIAPVLPGETMTRLRLQSRAVSDPIQSKLVGWWKEYWFFYVKHRDLDGRDDFSEMMLDQNKDLSAYQEAAAIDYHHFANGINWTKLCLKRIVEEYFRDEGEAWDVQTIGSMPQAKVMNKNFMDSAILDDDYTVDDINVDANSDGQIDISEVHNAYMQWYQLRTQNLTEMDYEDYLRTYGVQTAPAEHHRPELIRYIRKWTYPTNTVEPTTGVPSSAAVWSCEESADKKRFFKEPGFIIGVTTTRPKIYMKRIAGSAAHGLTDALSWLPALMMDRPETSMKHFAQASGPLDAGAITDADGYWLDMRDIFLYGDHYVNYGIQSDLTSSAVDMETTNLRDYCTTVDIQELFVDTANRYIREDGIVSLNIQSHQRDVTPAGLGVTQS